MHLSSKALRNALLTLALVLSALAWGPQAATAACSNGSTQWVRTSGCCYASTGYTQKWKWQSCIKGVWVDNGATKCSGACAIL